MTPLHWVKLRIDTSVDAGELLGLLSDPVVQGAWQENGSIGRKVNGRVIV